MSDQKFDSFIYLDFVCLEAPSGNKRSLLASWMHHPATGEITQFTLKSDLLIAGY